MDLGRPLGDAFNIGPAAPGPVQRFPLAPAAFSLWVGSGAATLAFRQNIATVNVTRPGTAAFQIDLSTTTLQLSNGSNYRLSFAARASANVSIGLNARENGGNWTNYGLDATSAVSTAWTVYNVSFQSLASDDQARLSFFFGKSVAVYEVTNITVAPDTAPIYMRQYEHGAAIVNGDRRPHNVTLPAGRSYRRMNGPQAPRWQYIVDNDSPLFRAPGWGLRYIEGGYDFSQPTEEKIPGPYFHQWWGSCVDGRNTTTPAAWDLGVEEPGVYNVSVWWAADPDASGSWSQQAQYALVTPDGKAIHSQRQSQATGGDTWTLLFTEVALTPGTVLTLSCSDAATRSCIADAVLVESKARYNDGSPLETGAVRLGAFDGIVLLAAGARN